MRKFCDSENELGKMLKGKPLHLVNDLINASKVRVIIAPVIEDYKSGKITYAEAEFNARTKIYQSVNPSFNPDVEYMKDPIYRDIPSVDNSLFILARKLLLNA